MTDQSDLQPEQGSSEHAVQQPPAEGGSEAAPGSSGDYRDSLQSRRWNAAPLTNLEAEETDSRLVVLGLVILSAITLLVLVIGYGSGFWS
jgi:hypothetical protein